MNISWSITVCNEREEIERLLRILSTSIKMGDEIVVLFDKKNGTTDVEEFLDDQQNINLYKEDFNFNFSEWKNRLTELSTKDYIVNIDSDEYPNRFFLENIHTIIQLNDIDVISVPRINTVEGLTDSHIREWGWIVNEKGWVNFPDRQMRIYKNNGKIKWINKVHEVLDEYKTISHLPSDEEFCFYHPKTITKQEKQNQTYSQIS